MSNKIKYIPRMLSLFRDKIVEVTNSKRKTNLDKNSLCLKSDKVSNRIYEYLNSKA